MVYIAGLAVIMKTTGAGKIWFVWPYFIIPLLCLPLLALLPTLALPYFLIKSWRKKYWPAGQKTTFGVIVVFFLGFILYLAYWNLLEFQF